ncbi:MULTISPECIES: hypothetical protein [Gordonia]|uniref:Uncharacterized protein n=1 Tax=Gordonia amicalis TaxID=89053 RepID=A0AAE4UAA8_9ACTN|nr:MULTISPECIES: hypothetical protein [Gordonia]MCZ4582000.1 hypothetical protein [Gordonia amicalis]MDJ0455502.1 hypothetical protein [Gordonia amicalis]MDV6314341.1 hypothetical protein [Gordonia amicalis]MDV7078301.1 hypothetical protein [Gordonia amicalis]NKX79737.1 hypothetical protein [Gordonia amicalis]
MNTRSAASGVLSPDHATRTVRYGSRISTARSPTADCAVAVVSGRDHRELN